MVDGSKLIILLIDAQFRRYSVPSGPFITLSIILLSCTVHTTPIFIYVPFSLFVLGAVLQLRYGTKYM